MASTQGQAHREEAAEHGQEHASDLGAVELVHAVHEAAAKVRAVSTGILGKTMRDAVRNKERWKRRRAPTQDPSTDLHKARDGTLAEGVAPARVRPGEAVVRDERQYLKGNPL